MTFESPTRPTLLAALLVLLVLLVFGHAALTSGFVSDDFRFIVDNPRLQEEGALGHALIDPGVTDPEAPWGIVRPLRTLEFVLDGMLGGGSTPYHLHSLAWHALAVVLLFFLLRALVRSDRAALAGAAVWAVHPMQVESVVWVSSRADVAMGACVFAALLLALRSRGRDRYLVLSLAVSFVAMLYKETAFVLPLLVFAVRLTAWRERERGAIAAAARSVWPWLLVAGAYWVYRDAVRVGIPISADSGSLEELSHTAYTLGGSVAGTFATMFKGFAAYLGFAVLPIRPAVDWLLPVSTTLVDAAALLCLAIHVALVSIAIAAVRRAPVVSTAICVFYFALLPVSNWPFSLGIPTTERFLYLPLAGLALLLAAGVEAATRGGRPRLGQLKRVALPIAMAVACLATGSIIRARDWRTHEAFAAATMRRGDNPRTLTESATRKSQAGWRLLKLSRASKKPDEAQRLLAAGEAMLEDALADAAAARASWLEWAPVGDVPGHPIHLSDEASAFAALGLARFEDAISFADRALSLNDSAPRAHYARGWSLLETSRPREAIAAMLAAERNGVDLREPEYVVFFGRAARALASDGLIDEARHAYGTALALDIPGPATEAVRRELNALDGP